MTKTLPRQSPIAVARLLLWTLLIVGGAGASTSSTSAQDAILEDVTAISKERMDLMVSRMRSAKFTSSLPGFPEGFEPDPLYRYDDPTRGYVDATVWRLGHTGRPLALATIELHPLYLGQGPRFVHEFLAIADAEFRCQLDGLTWSPTESAIEMRHLDQGPLASPSETIRLAQIKRMADRFAARQVIEEITQQRIELRLLPTPIDRYQPTPHERADAAIFLFVNGRNPGLALLIETDGKNWKYGIGRLSLPSRLVVTLDRKTVLDVEATLATADRPYHAINVPGEIPGYESGTSLPQQ